MVISNIVDLTSKLISEYSYLYQYQRVKVSVRNVSVRFYLQT